MLCRNLLVAKIASGIYIISRKKGCMDGDHLAKSYPCWDWVQEQTYFDVRVLPYYRNILAESLQSLGIVFLAYEEFLVRISRIPKIPSGTQNDWEGNFICRESFRILEPSEHNLTGGSCSSSWLVPTLSQPLNAQMTPFLVLVSPLPSLPW